MKPFSPTAKSSRNGRDLKCAFDPTAGFDHAGPHLQRDLPPFPQGRPSRHGNAGGAAMTEIVVSLLAFLSISVFLAHAFDAYRAG
jgi:hypothetical protein